MQKRRDITIFSISFLDLLSGALGAVIILYIAVPKATITKELSDKNKVELVSKKLDKIKQDLVYCQKSLKENLEILTATKAKNKANQINCDKKISEMKKLNEEKKAKTKKQKLEPVSVSNTDSGFNFKGKKIIFVIDVSGSMQKGDRIGQVKAGLKMLITSMSSEFMVDIVYFPDGSKSDYKPLWEWLNFIDKNNKKEIYKFLHNLKPYGSTPTRGVMEYVLNSYGDATDLVLLSDGAPTKSNSRELEDIDELIKYILKKNAFGIQINTIGVGRDFFTDKKNSKYVFLKRLADETGGFFVGF